MQCLLTDDKIPDSHLQIIVAQMMFFSTIRNNRKNFLKNKTETLSLKGEIDGHQNNRDSFVERIQFEKKKWCAVCPCDRNCCDFT